MLSSKSTSNIIPYMCAEGSIATTFEVELSIGRTFLAKKMLDHNAL